MSSFKTQLIALVSGLILIFIFIIFLIFRGIDKTRQDLIEINKLYLAQITLKLELALWQDSFKSILKKNLFSNYDRNKKIGFLSIYFIKLLEGEVNDFPGVDFGYYDDDLDAIVGCPPPLGPPLPQKGSNNNIEAMWTPIEIKLKADAIKQLSRGLTAGHQDIFLSERLGKEIFLFYIHPLVRENKFIGTSWAIMEFRDFYEPLKENIQISLTVIVFGILAALTVGNNLRRGVNYIQNGLERLKFDLTYRFSGGRGEIGEIAMAINEMASRLIKVRSYTQLILEGAGEGVIAVDKDSEIVFFNKAAGLLLNIKMENIIGQDYREIFSEKDLLRESIKESMKGINKDILKTIYRLSDGKEIPLSISCFSLSQEAQGGAVIILRDLSDTERFERKLRQADKLAALGKLVAGVAHEVRNPIAAIRANVQLWEKRIEKNKPSRESLNMVIEEIDRLNGIVEKWLIFARYRAISRERFQINTVIERAAELMRVEIKNRKIEFSCNLSEDLPEVNINHQEIEQVIINLMQNSLDILEENSKLIIKSAYEKETGQVKVEIIDTGPGIPLEIQDKIFDPFFTTKEEGTGLGLAVCYDIISSYGGNMDFETYAGKGSNFYFTIPVGEDK
ncbi:MAG: Sensor protein ZraS [bacterium ADurb.Bin363]|nr:MAG: Sensor protein ZraS [bacterium ADurb.Bin363]